MTPELGSTALGTYGSDPAPMLASDPPPDDDGEEEHEEEEHEEEDGE